MKNVTFIALLLFVAAYGDHHEHHEHHEDHVNHQAHSVKTEQDFIKYHDYCVSHQKIPAEASLRYKNFEHADDGETHKYLKCLYEQYGFLDSQGHFDDQAIHEQLAAKLGQKAVHTHDDETHHMVTAKYEHKSEEDFMEASERCLKRDNLSNDYNLKFQSYDYPDEPAVHKFIHCVWQNMGLWDNRKGFNVEHIADLYKDRANTEVLVPIISECNRDYKGNETPLKWCYNGFICMLNSRVGQWFKDDMNAKRKN